MLQAIEEQLTASELENAWSETLDGWSGDPATKTALREWIATERDDILNVARAALDPKDLETSLMVRYIELRSQWIRHNAMANYTLLRTGEAPLETMFRGSLITTLILALESHINQADLEKACDFLATPLSGS